MLVEILSLALSFIFSAMRYSECSATAEIATHTLTSNVIFPDFDKGVVLSCVLFYSICHYSNLFGLSFSMGWGNSLTGRFY